MCGPSVATLACFLSSDRGFRRVAMFAIFFLMAGAVDIEKGEDAAALVAG